MAEQAEELSPVPDDNLSWCHDAVQDVSRTFAITVDVLQEPMSTYVCVGYLMCRIADTIEDSDTLTASEKAALLERYDRVLDPMDEYGMEEFDASLEPHIPTERTDDWAVVADASRVVRTFEQLPPDVRESIIPPTRELVQGMAMFVQRNGDAGGIRITSEDELEEYCYYVAGTVGHLLTNLLTRRVDDEAIVEDLRSTATGFGLLLQLVNVSKDVHVDYTQENSVYLPAEWLAEANASQENLLSPEKRQNVLGVVERTIEHARSYLDDAHAYLETLSRVDRNAFASLAIPYLLAVGTLRELSDRPEDTLTPGGVKITREEVSAIMGAVLADDPRSLSALRQAVRRGDMT